MRAKRPPTNPAQNSPDEVLRTPRLQEQTNMEMRVPDARVHPLLQRKKKPKRRCPCDEDERMHQQGLVGFVFPAGKCQRYLLGTLFNDGSDSRHPRKMQAESVRNLHESKAGERHKRKAESKQTLAFQCQTVASLLLRRPEGTTPNDSARLPFDKESHLRPDD